MVTLTVLPLRVVYRAQRDIVLANPATAVRGAFGMALRNAVCVKECAGGRECPQGQGVCFSARFFDGALTAEQQAKAPSGYRQDPPRPFVLRPGLRQGFTPRGTEWTLDVYCFDPAGVEMEKLARALERMGDDGLGAVRAPSTVVRVEGLDERFLPQAAVRSHVLPLPVPQATAAELVEFRFRTPTEIVSNGRVVDEPEFPLFIQALGNRIQALCRFYGQGYWREGELADFRGLAGEGRMRILRSANPVRQRTSTRTGQQQTLGGFTGDVEYMASWRSYQEWLTAGLWTGVGKHTQFGHGHYTFREAASESNRGGVRV